MIHIHDKEVNKIAECNLPHDIINPSKRAKNLDIHYSTIIHGLMNTRHGKAKFKNFKIILGSVCSSTIVIRGIIETLHPEKNVVMQCHK